MDDDTRRIVAYISARIASTRQGGAIYDYQTNNFYNYSGTINNERVNIYDYATSNYVTGNRGGEKFSLFNYHTGSYMDFIVVNGNKFRGYDYGHAVHFEVTAKENGSVELYDYGMGRYFSYKL